jgi:[protein-PII] uridylyltransferase
MTMSNEMRSSPSREGVIADTSLGGGAMSRALSDATDVWLEGVFKEATSDFKKSDGMVLLAVGGYGRRELAPQSDLDILLVHKSVKTVSDIASKIWYPVWDTGVKLGHSVRTPKETLKLCETDLDTATSLVTARVITGNAKLGEEVIAGAMNSWRKRGRSWLVELHARTLQRYATNGEVAFLLEPNLKEGLGGLRDIHALQWAIEAGLDLSSDDIERLEQCNEVLLGIRVALHRHAGRAIEVLRLEDQRPVATLAGYATDDELMAAIAEVGRQIAWISDEAWARLNPPANSSSSPQSIAPGVQLLNGEVHLTNDVNIADDPTLLLRVATAAARLRARIDRSSLERLALLSPVWPDPWPAGASDDLVALLLEGDAAIPVLESLDQRNLLVRVLPEWEPVRSKPQRNAFHRFTVDRHLWQTVANAASLVGRVTRPDLLVISALFHDIGKGYPGDHTDVGVDMFEVIGPRMGLQESDVDIVVSLIRYHLLLADTATRRDLSDDATITMVAEALQSTVVLDLLHALTESDSLATGPSAWSDWKAELITLLVDRTRHVIGGGDVQEVVWRLFPDATVLELMATGETAVRTQSDRVTIVSPDRPGTFSRVAGALALHNLDVLGAEAHSDEQGMAASEFRVSSPYGEIDWAPVVDSLERALLGRLAIDSRLADRAANAKPRRATSAVAPAAPTVRFDESASSNSTFIEVRAPDMVGVLHRITRAIAELGLDIRHARVLTLGNEVVDTFYIRESNGDCITDENFKNEISRAILHALS